MEQRANLVVLIRNRTMERIARSMAKTEASTKIIAQELSEALVLLPLTDQREVLALAKRLHRYRQQRLRHRVLLRRLRRRERLW